MGLGVPWGHDTMTVLTVECLTAKNHQTNQCVTVTQTNSKAE